jgi:hypothetical protein
VGELTRRAAAVPALAVALTASVALSGCTSSHGAASGRHSAVTGATSRPTASSSPARRGEYIPGQTVTKAPNDIDGKVLVKRDAAHGSQSMDLPGGLSSGTFGISVNCEGKGTLTVTLRPVNLSFPLGCIDGQVSSTYNEIALKRKHTYGTLDIHAAPSVRWSLSAGYALPAT